MLENSHLVRSLCAYWQGSLEEDWPTIYPGMPADASRWEAWLELTVPLFTEPVGRETGLPMLAFTVDVHCFCQRDENLGRIRQMVDCVRRLLSRRAIMIRDFELSGLPAIGWARFKETSVRDLTRVEQAGAGRPLFHFLVSVQGIAQLSEV